MNAATTANSGAAIPESTAPLPSAPPGWEFSHILPPLPVICGRRLLPLSIGRYRRMKRQNIAFVSDTYTTATAGDLLQAVLICSMTCAEYDAFITDPTCGPEIERWAKRIGLLPPRYLDWPIIGGWINRIVGEEVTQKRAERDAAYILNEIQRFQEYIVEAQRIPNYTRKENEPARQTLHWSNSIELHLRSEQNWTSHEIDETPLNKALTDYFGYAEAHGLISILTDEDLAMAEANGKALRAAMEQMQAAQAQETK